MRGEAGDLGPSDPFWSIVSPSNLMVGWLEKKKDEEKKVGCYGKLRLEPCLGSLGKTEALGSAPPGGHAYR